MEFVMDDDVQTVLEFMQAKIATCKLAQVAESVAAIGSVLWGRYKREEFSPISLQGEPIISTSCAIPQAAIESAQSLADADGGSGVAVHVQPQ